MIEETQAAIPADAVPRRWVERAPQTWRPYLRLARLDRPIGAWLLFWPCVFGLALGAAEQQRGFLTAASDWWLLVLFAAGAMVMRGAGCTYNDIVDRDIDARVARTLGRPIPSGAVSVKQAVIFLAAQCAIGLLILLCLNPFSIALGAASLMLIAVYPFMKRITWWPQAWLGLTFNWGALLGFAAQTARITTSALLLYAACFFWTLGYDTIYALQDIEDDALVGVKSTARLFGARAPFWILIFYFLFVILIGLAVALAFKPWFVLLLLLPLLAHLVWQVRTLKPGDPQSSLRLFRANRDAGTLAGAALIAASWIFA
ncbi:MAG TPA: 4-hydroxybenzoate octaprenyltransferase [Rhizomicrobium sp.]|nr:4-hydroxybenzoate octaprenyltransferase [Rhizomicrobium sp.]